MMRRVLCAAALAAVAAAAPVHARPPDTARVYVTVLDNKNKPLRNLTAADFVVKEDGAARTIVSVEPATTPISVALLTDHFGGDSTYGLLDVRAALDSIVRRFHKAPAPTSMSLTTIDPAAIRVVAFTESEAAITGPVGKIAPGADQAVFLEAVADACAALSRASSDRRVIFAVIAGYKPDLSTMANAQVGEALRATGASLWVLEGRSSFRGGVPNANRDELLNLGVRASGGARASVAVGTALESQGLRLVDLILAQYAVTYAAPGNSARSLEVAVRTPEAKTIAPLWIAHATR